MPSQQIIIPTHGLIGIFSQYWCSKVQQGIEDSRIWRKSKGAKFLIGAHPLSSQHLIDGFHLVFRPYRANIVKISSHEPILINLLIQMRSRVFTKELRCHRLTLLEQEQGLDGLPQRFHDYQLHSIRLSCH